MKLKGKSGDGKSVIEQIDSARDVLFRRGSNTVSKDCFLNAVGSLRFRGTSVLLRALRPIIADFR